MLAGSPVVDELALSRFSHVMSVASIKGQVTWEICPEIELLNR
jgi:hypothetical protein